MAACVQEYLVLWQVNGDGDENGGEGSKVCCYYGLADRADLPAVLIVDLVTGQLMERLHRVTAAAELLAATDKFTKSKPAKPVVRANRSATAPPPPPSALTNVEQEKIEKVCKMRVRFPDGEVVSKEFGGQCRVEVLFDYCWSVIGGELPFWVMRAAAAGAMEEVREEKDVSFEQLGLNLSTLYVLLD